MFKILANKTEKIPPNDSINNIEAEGAGTNNE